MTECGIFQAFAQAGQDAAPASPLIDADQTGRTFALAVTIGLGAAVGLVNNFAQYENMGLPAVRGQVLAARTR